VKLADYAGGKSYEHHFTDSEFRDIVGPVASRLQELCESVVANEDEKSAVKYVECIGGATNLPVFGQAVQSAFPKAGFHQANPDQVVTVGASLDAAQVTNRLPPEQTMKIVSIVPYSIGTSVVGGIMSFLIQRGEPLPAVGVTSFVTTIDNQKSATIPIFQGEHLLAERNTRLGKAEITDLPPRPREQCQVCCRIEYNDNGILFFSATEPSTGKEVNATLVAKHDFTDEDHARMGQESHASRQEEARLGWVKYLRSMFALDIRRAKVQFEYPEVRTAGLKWGDWLEAHEEGEMTMFDAKWREMISEFYAFNPAGWPDPAGIRPLVRFAPIWPIDPTFVGDGSAIVHFLIEARFASVYLDVKNLATDDVLRVSDTCQMLSQDGMADTFMRIPFPANGKYSVSAFAAIDANSRHFGLPEVGNEWFRWKFDVQNAPSKNRPLPSLLAGRKSGKLPLPETFQVEPSDWCVKCTGRDHKFTCKYQGKSLNVNGRELPGEPEQTFFAKITPRAGSNGWLAATVTLTCPADGVWRLLFFIDGEHVATQFVMAGSIRKLALTVDEKAAITAKRRS
jgi:hypothetical protein